MFQVAETTFPLCISFEAIIEKTTKRFYLVDLVLTDTVCIELIGALKKSPP